MKSIARISLLNFRKCIQTSIHLFIKLLVHADCHKFHVYIDEHPTALAECFKCKNKFVLYDLSLYPNAIKLSEQFEMKKFNTINGLDVFELCVLYEYSDEFEFSDENFDVNDITGFSLFAYDYDIGKIITIFDDETA